MEELSQTLKFSAFFHWKDQNNVSELFEGSVKFSLILRGCRPNTSGFW